MILRSYLKVSVEADHEQAVRSPGFQGLLRVRKDSSLKIGIKIDNFLGLSLVSVIMLPGIQAARKLNTFSDKSIANDSYSQIFRVYRTVHSRKT